MIVRLNDLIDLYAPNLQKVMSIGVVVGIMIDFLARDGLINNVLGAIGIQPTGFMQNANWYWTLYVGSSIWQAVGWGSIIYVAAIANLDQTLYEAGSWTAPIAGGRCYI